ncbi:hypothetical protein [Granulicella sibirica]|nr:hypothetical protein [Granulicella sibirica]
MKEDVASGRYASVDEYIAEVVELLHEREQWRGESLQEQRDGLETA